MHEAHEAAREAVRGALSAATLRSALRRLLPLPARARYVLVTLQPQAPLAARVVRACARSPLLAWTLCVWPRACRDRRGSCRGLLVPSQWVAALSRRGARCSCTMHWGPYGSAQAARTHVCSWEVQAEWGAQEYASA